MKSYRLKRNYENVTKRRYDGVGEFDIPQLAPTQYEPCEFLGFNLHKTGK